MAFYRKLRKLIRNPKQFFADAKMNKQAAEGKVIMQKLALAQIDGGKSVVAVALKDTPKAAPKTAPKLITKADPKMVPKTATKDAPVGFERWLAYSESVRAFALAYPVNVIKYRDFHMWPALRFYIWLRLICDILGKNITNKNLITASPSMIWRKNYAQEFGAVSVDDLDGSSTKVDFLVFSNQNSIDLCGVEGVSYNRLSDPLYEKLASYGAVQKVELLKGHTQLPRIRHITPRYMMPSVVRSTRHHLLVDGLAEAIPAMIQAFPKAELTEGLINFYIDEFFNLKESYKKILLEYQPRCAFFSPIDYSFPLIMACKECSVQAVDIQHGNHVGFNLPYNHWDEAPVGGYSLFPDVFLGWGLREKRALSQNFPSTKVLTAGYPWLDYFGKIRREESSVIKRALAEVGYYRRVVAITMRDQVDFPEILRNIISDPRAEETGIVFLIKPHPKNNRLVKIPNSNRVLMPKGIKDISIADMSSYVDLHMTVNSSSIFEFEYYGIPSFVFGDEPLVDYADLIEEGRLTYISNMEDFYHHLNELGERPSFSPLIDNNSDEFDAYLSSIVANRPVIAPVAA